MRVPYNWLQEWDRRWGKKAGGHARGKSSRAFTQMTKCCKGRLEGPQVEPNLPPFRSMKRSVGMSNISPSLKRLAGWEGNLRASLSATIPSHLRLQLRLTRTRNTVRLASCRVNLGLTNDISAETARCIPKPLVAGASMPSRTNLGEAQERCDMIQNRYIVQEDTVALCNLGRPQNRGSSTVNHTEYLNTP